MGIPLVAICVFSELLCDELRVLSLIKTTVMVIRHELLSYSGDRVCFTTTK